MTPTSRRGKPALLTGRRTPAKVAAQVARWQDYLSLGSWDVRFVDLPCDHPEERASTNFDPVRKRSIIRIAPDVPVSQIDREIVHELLHAMMIEAKRNEEWAIERLVDALTGTDIAQWGDGDDVAPWRSAFPLN